MENGVLVAKTAGDVAEGVDTPVAKERPDTSQPLGALQFDVGDEQFGILVGLGQGFALWAENEIKPKTYAAGTWGPSAAVALAERDGVTWHDD